MNALRTIESEQELGKAILDEIGINIGQDYMLYDEETGAPIQFQGKNIKFSYTDPNLVYLGTGDILFDPTHNLRMITTMLGMYLDKEAESGKETVCMCDDYNKQEHTSSHTVKFSGGNSVESRFYRNKCLAICDNFMQFANIDSDLSKFDDMED